MGQRLIITIKQNDEDLAKIYYHWSAYTYSALLETKKVIDCIYNHEEETVDDFRLRLVKFVEENGGGIRGDEYEFEYIKKIYPNSVFKTDNYSRSNGLIALSEKGMKELQDWSEGDIIIDLDDDTVENNVFGWYENVGEYNEEQTEWDDDFEVCTIDDIKEIHYNIGNFDVEDIDDIVEEIYNVDRVCRFGSEIFEMIE